MNTARSRYGSAKVWETVKPACAGLLLACAVTALLIAAFSLFFVMIESLAKSAVVPLALLSAAMGCFVGAFICASMAKRRGLFFGAAVGLAMFAAVSLIGLVCNGGIFGTQTVVRLAVMLTAGCVGGYLGCGHRSKRRK